MMEDGKGAYAVIGFIASDEPNKGLGYYLCPDENQGPTHAAIMKELSEKETRQVLHQRLVPKLSYKLQLSTMTKNQCNTINTWIRQSVFPQMRLNRNMPNGVVYGLEEYGGVELPEVYTLQDELQITNIVKQL